MKIRTRAIASTIAGALLLAACAHSPAALTMLIDARREAADLHVQFSRAVDQSGQAVLAENDADASASARAAEAATGAVTKDIADLRTLLDQLQFTAESSRLQSFATRFDEYRRLEAEILELAVDNTNVKAQRLAFGPGREAADAFVQALETLAPPGATRTDPRIDAQVSRASAAARELQALEPRHIAEAHDDVMVKMEREMREAETRANAAVAALARMNPPGAAAALVSARAALDRFSAVNTEVVTLSRRNSGVRSIGLSVGKKRVLAAECDDLLGQLEEALAGREFPATR